MGFRKWCSTVVIASLLGGLALVPGVASAASVTATVNWNSTTGKNATNLHYGLNIYKAFEGSSVSSNTTYKNNVAYMKPGIIRYHRADQMAESRSGYPGYSAGGWVQNPGTSAYAWDYAKIDSILSQTFGNNPVRMINLANWPSYMDDGTGKLKTTAYNDYANFVLALVDYVNGTKGYNVQYWEILNEVDNDGGPYASNFAAVATIYNTVATKIKNKYPSLKVGGPAFARPDLTSQVTTFISNAHANLDFVSYHSYSSGNTACGATPQTNAQMWDSAASNGAITTSIKSIISNHTTRAIETFHDEYNISWCPPDSRMNDIKGAVFDALTMVSVASAGATGAMAWNEADGWYGKLDGSYNQRPASHVYKIFNEDMTGSIVSTSVSDASKIAVMAVKSGNWRKIAIINRSEASQTVQLNITGASSNVKASSLYTVKRVYSWGLNYDNVAHGNLTGSGGYTIPADTVTVLVMDEGNISSGNKVNDYSLEAGSNWLYYYGSRVNSNARTGNYAAQVGTGAAVYQTISGLSPNTKYTLRAWSKKQYSGSSGYIYVKNYGGSEVTSSVAGTGYGENVITFTTGSSNTGAEIGIWGSSGSGFFWADDFELYQEK